MALYNLIGRRRRHDVIDAVPLLAEKLRAMFSCFNFSASKRFFVIVLIEMNVNISNELNFSTQCSLQFDKSQKNENYSLNNYNI